jgi:DNA transformation protein and related proteins
MSVDQSLIDWIAEAMEPIGTVTHRPMMGGATLYCDSTVFAIIAMDALWFKGDKETDAIWDAEGCERFTYEFVNGRIGSMNYRRAPDEVHDDADALRHWAQLGLEAGHRAPPKKPRKAKAKL